MTSLIPFQFESHQVRVVEIEGSSTVSKMSEVGVVSGDAVLDAPNLSTIGEDAPTWGECHLVGSCRFAVTPLGEYADAFRHFVV